jgi:hypothetical protein
VLVYSHGMLASMVESASSMKPKALILTARKSPESWDIRLSSCLAIELHYSHIVRTLSSVYAHSSHRFTVQQSDNNGCCSNSNGDSYTKDGSESGDEQYGVPGLAKS